MKFIISISILFLMFSCAGEKSVEEKKLKVLFMDRSSIDFDMLTDMFNEMTGIEVEIDFVKYDEQFSKIMESAEKEVGEIDIFALDLIWTASFAEENICIPIDDKITDFKDDIADPVWDAFLYDNKIWAMPFVNNFQVLFYNTDHLKWAGFTAPPKTLEEMVEILKAIKDKGIVKYPWSDSWNQKEGLICEYVWITGAFGGDTFDNEGRPIFNTGAGLEALNFMKMLLDEGLANPIALYSDESAAKDTFITGECSITTNWPFQTAEMKDPEKSSVVDSSELGLIPVSEKVLNSEYETTSISGFQGLSIAANSRYKDEAWLFIKFITSPLVYRAYLAEMPVWNSIQNDPLINIQDKTMQVRGRSLSNVHHRPRVSNYNEVSSIMQRYIHLALRGELPVKEALDKAVNEIEASN